MCACVLNSSTSTTRRRLLSVRLLRTNRWIEIQSHWFVLCLGRLRGSKMNGKLELDRDLNLEPNLEYETKPSRDADETSARA